MRYHSENHKQAVIQKWQRSGLSLSQFAKKEGMSTSTLHGWRVKYLDNVGSNIVVDKKNTDDWSAEKRFAAVLETAMLSEVEVNEYCRKKGLYPKQIKEWKQSFIAGDKTIVQERKDLAQERKADQKRIKELEKELKRKDAALAETAALLVLRKKLNAYWGEEEDS